MRLLNLRLLSSLVLAASFCQAALSVSQAISQLPACGTACILQAMPKSPCSSVTNTTCLCGSTELFSVVQDCVLATCNGPEAIKTGLVQAQLCDLPHRLRKVDIHVAGVLHGIALVAICVRIYSRWYTMDRSGLDDWLVVAILPLYMAFLFCGHYAGQLAFGIDIWYVEPSAITEALKVFYAGETLYVALLGLTKASMLCFYLRVFPHQEVRQAVYVTLGIVGVSTTALILMQIFQCIPVSLIWEGWTQGLAFLAGDKRCINVNALVLSVAGVSIVLDVAILSIPVPVVYKLDKRVRGRAAGMFGLGIFVLVASCARIKYILTFGGSRNPTWDATDALIWSGIEIAVSVLVISLPAIRVLLRVISPAKDPGGLPAITSARGYTFRQRLTSIDGSGGFRPNLRGGASRMAEDSRPIELKDATNFSNSTANTSSQLLTDSTMSSSIATTIDRGEGGDQDRDRDRARGGHGSDYARYERGKR